jgi:hypothetical protein
MKYRIYSIPRKVESVAKRRGRAPLRAKKKKSTKMAATDSSFELTPATDEDTVPKHAANVGDMKPKKEDVQLKI